MAVDFIIYLFSLLNTKKSHWNKNELF